MVICGTPLFLAWVLDLVPACRSGVLIEASPVTFAKLQRNRGSAKNIL